MGKLNRQGRKGRLDCQDVELVFDDVCYRSARAVNEPYPRLRVDERKILYQVHHFAADVGNSDVERFYRPVARGAVLADLQGDGVVEFAVPGELRRVIDDANGIGIVDH